MARRKGEIVRAGDEELYVRQNITGANAGHQRLENEVAKNSIDEECRRQHAADPPRPAEDQQHRRQRDPDEAGVSQLGEKEHHRIQNPGAQSLQNRQKHQFNVHKAPSFSFRCVQDTRSL